MPAISTLDEEESGAESEAGLWAQKVGYATASKDEMRQLAEIPFLSYPGVPLFRKQLSVHALPEVSTCSSLEEVPEDDSKMTAAICHT